MKRQIIKGPGYCAVTEDGHLVEYLPTEQADHCGDILLGRIDRMMPGMKCAFADIGRKRSGFLPLDEVSRSFSGPPARSGELMILQIKKEEIGEKGAFLTRDIAFPGKLIILMPLNRYIGVSARISDQEMRDRLKKEGNEIAGGRFGLIMRNASAGIESEMVRLEAENLYKQWINAAEKASAGGKPGRIIWSGDPVEQIKADYAASGFEEIYASEKDNQEIRRELRQAAERKVMLPGGGNIVIDLCEAMTVIDINTASAGTGRTKRQNVLETNLEACGMIARQVRLRNLNGIILIDFIDMDEETDRSLVCEKLTECFSYDRIKTVIHGWTKLGLMEMTRKRIHQGQKFQTEDTADSYD